VSYLTILVRKFVISPLRIPDQEFDVVKRVGDSKFDLDLGSNLSHERLLLSHCDALADLRERSHRGLELMRFESREFGEEGIFDVLLASSKLLEFVVERTHLKI
jgi:hypothetical protein